MNISRFSRAAVVALGVTTSSTGIALAETNQLRIAQQFGIAYLPLIVASEKGLERLEGIPESDRDFLLRIPTGDGI